jgi:hypothetical protein
VPNVMVGEKLHITYNPYQLDAALVLDTNADGHEALHSIPRVIRDDAGFRTDGNVVGEDYNRPAATVLDAHRKEVKRFAYEAATDTEVEAKVKAKVTPFGGRLDPFKVIEQAPQRTYLPKQGNDLQTAVKTAAATAQPQILQGFALALALKAQGVAMNRERNAQVAAWYPDGVPESDLPALVARLSVRAGLRVVAGGMA